MSPALQCTDFTLNLKKKKKKEGRERITKQTRKKQSCLVLEGKVQLGRRWSAGRRLAVGTLLRVSSCGGAGPRPSLSFRLLEAAAPRVAAVLCTRCPRVETGGDDAG